MGRLLFVILISTLAVTAFGKTHNDTFSVPCRKVWLAVKGVLRNSGKYQVVQIDNNEMSASFIIGGALDRKRINSLVLNPQNANCVLNLQTRFSGVNHNDAGAFEKRVKGSLAKSAAPTKPDDAAK